MKTFRLILILAVLSAAPVARLPASEPPLDSHFEIFRPFLEKTWKGQFKNSTPDKPVVDVARWERALNGRAIRVLHSVNDGIYGGETIFTWDAAKQCLVYHYFTTDGDRTTGTLISKDGKFVTSEVVTGDADGVTEVRATTDFLPDGGYHVKAEYLKKGEWTPGHELTYKEDASAKVVFK